MAANMDDHNYGAYCPFYSRERNGNLECEAGKIKFPDKTARREFIYTYCASSSNYENCTLCRMLMTYYERKYYEGKETDNG